MHSPFAYIGGKFRLSKQIHEVLDQDPETPWDFSIFDETKPADPLKSLVKKQ